MTIVSAMQGPAEMPPNMQQAMQLAREVQAQSQAAAQELAREQLRQEIQRAVQEQVQRDVQRAIQRGELNEEQLEEIAERAAEQATERAAEQAALAAGRQIVVRRPGEPTTYVTVPNTRDMMPPEVVDITIAFFAAIVLCIVGLPIARAWARRMDRRPAPAASPEVSAQLQQLQQSVEAIAIEVERISEAQRFTARLLGEGAAQPVGAQQGERVAAR